MIRRRAWWSAWKLFFATVLGITHRVAARVSKSLRQLFLKRFLKMLESGIDPATVRFEVGNCPYSTTVNVRAKHGERRPINGFRQAMALQRFKNAKPAGELW